MPMQALVDCRLASSALTDQSLLTSGTIHTHPSMKSSSFKHYQTCKIVLTVESCNPMGECTMTAPTFMSSHWPKHSTRTMPLRKKERETNKNCGCLHEVVFVLFLCLPQTQKACPTPARWKLCERKCMRL